MPKSKSDLSGGLGDTNPQWLKIPAAVYNLTTTPLSGVTSVTQTFQLPINRLQQRGKDRVAVVEVLKVRWYFASNNLVNNSTGLIGCNGYLVYGSNVTPSALSQVKTAVLDNISLEQYTTYAAANNAGGNPNPFSADMTPVQFPVVNDLTDGAGHGILVAVDSMSLVFNTQVFDFAAPSASTVYTTVPTLDSWAGACEIMYRFKEVALTEYVGIVQSQQSAAV